MIENLEIIFKGIKILIDIFILIRRFLSLHISGEYFEIITENVRLKD